MLFLFSEVFPLKAKRLKFREKPHLEGAEFTKSSQPVAKTAAEILCHCSYTVYAWTSIKAAAIKKSLITAAGG